MNVENTVENTLKTKNRGGVTGKGFDVNGQPSPEQKKAGWEKKKGLKYWIEYYTRLPFEQFSKIIQEFEKNPSKSKLIANQVIALNYVKKSMEADPKFVLDRLDRKYGKPTQTVKNEGGLEIKITKEVVNPNSGNQD